jgi:hypothetical protein
MEPEIMVKAIDNAFANEETGIEITIFRAKFLLTMDEASSLYSKLMGTILLLPKTGVEA